MPVLDLTQRAHATIGRQHENSLVVYDAACSRRHCVLKRIDQTWHVEDLSSRNGTFVNDRPIYSVCPLINGDRLQVGSTRFQFVEIAPTDA
jgi:pSer/pThr/pTyr-binding forkhead associated (FHA) protein